MRFLREGKGRITALLLLALLLSVMCCSALCEEDSGNILYNGDFEILDGEGLPDGWFTEAYRMEPGISAYSVKTGMDGEGSSAAAIHNAGSNDARYAQTVAVEPDSFYCLSGYVRAENITEGHGANLSIDGLYAFSEKSYDTEGEWKYIEYYGKTGPDQHELTVFARVGGYSGESKGSASFDHLRLIRVDTIPGGVLADQWFQPSRNAEENPNGGDPEGGLSEENVPGPAWPWLAGLIALPYTAAVLLAAYCFFRHRTTWRKQPKISALWFFPFLALALALRIVLSYFIEGYGVDVGCFVSWGQTMARNGPLSFYENTGFCDYPPLYTYILGLNAWSANALGLTMDSGWTRIIFRLFPSICDVAACGLLLYLPRNRFTETTGYRILIVLLAFNPVSVLNSAAWGQMDSVLCLLLMGVAVAATEGKWIPAIGLYVTAILVKPQALMLGFLGLVFMILRALKNKEEKKKILIGSGIGVFLILCYVVPFSIHQQPGWLIGKYRETLESYPYATLNTANLYYLAGGNWSNIQSTANWLAPVFLAAACAAHGTMWTLRNRNRKFFLIETALSAVSCCFFAVCAITRANWGLIGTGAMVYAFVIVLSLAVRSNDIRMLPYLGALLFILLYVFGIKMHERYLFPAFLLLMLAWALQKDRRILFLLVFFSVTVFINEGIVLDNSIRLGASGGHLNADTIWLADILSLLNVGGAVLAAFLGYDLLREEQEPGFLPVRTIGHRRVPGDDYRPDRSLHWALRDTLILGGITLCFTVVTMTTLGSAKAPQTVWRSTTEEEQVVFDLGEHRDGIRILYFGQVSHNDFSFAQSEDGIVWSDETFAQMDQGQCWKWKYVTLSSEDDSGERVFYNSPEYVERFSGRYVRLTSGSVGLALNEILFRDTDGKNIPARIVSRSGEDLESAILSEPENLLDEQDTMENLPGFFRTQEGETQPSWWNSTYFDEIYHARTGYEFTVRQVPYETSHPPLGKVFISWCISLFGMTPFGWRFAGAFAGILMLPGMYLLTKQLTKKTWISGFACALLALDCMHLTQTQIATIDSFPVLFILYAFFFMLRFLQTDLRKEKMMRILIPLAFSGLNMGLAIASKWIGIYAGIGLAVLYFWHCFRSMRMACREGESILARVFFISLACIGFFVIVPVAIYLLSYIPYLAYNTRIRDFGSYLDAVWRSQIGMFNYHSTPRLGMDHPFYSPWWEWPIIGKPMFYATEQYIPRNAFLHHSIFCFGNPAVWWTGIAALVLCLFRWIQGKRYLVKGETNWLWHLTGESYSIRYEFLLIGLLAQYLPWVLVPRGTYIYHYFASVPFLILALALCLDWKAEKAQTALRIAAAVFLFIAAGMFVILLPYATGIAAPVWWLDIGKKLLRIWY